MEGCKEGGERFIAENPHGGTPRSASVRKISALHSARISGPRTWLYHEVNLDASPHLPSRHEYLSVLPHIW